MFIVEVAKLSNFKDHTGDMTQQKLLHLKIWDCTCSQLELNGQLAAGPTGGLHS